MCLKDIPLIYVYGSFICEISSLLFICMATLWAFVDDICDVEPKIINDIHIYIQYLWCLTKEIHIVIPKILFNTYNIYMNIVETIWVRHY